jgi:hypothetical protein
VDSAGFTWIRTEFAYAFKPTPDHAPRLASGVEYAAASGGPVVTLHAPAERLHELERAILGTMSSAGGGDK